MGKELIGELYDSQDHPVDWSLLQNVPSLFPTSIDEVANLSDTLMGFEAGFTNVDDRITEEIANRVAAIIAESNARQSAISSAIASLGDAMAAQLATKAPLAEMLSALAGLTNQDVALNDAINLRATAADVAASLLLKAPLTNPTFSGVVGINGLLNLTGTLRLTSNLITAAATTLVTGTGAVTGRPNQFVDATAANATITLPGNPGDGYVYTIKKVDAGTNTVTILGNFDGKTNIVLTSQYDYVTIISTSTAGVWRVINKSSASAAVPVTAKGSVSTTQDLTALTSQTHISATLTANVSFTLPAAPSAQTSYSLFFELTASGGAWTPAFTSTAGVRVSFDLALPPIPSGKTGLYEARWSGTKWYIMPAVLEAT